jgi:hypothetical protein
MIRKLANDMAKTAERIESTREFLPENNAEGH